MEPGSIYNLQADSETNGHINRNIRSCMALIDLAKPYLVIETLKQNNNDSSS